MKVDVCHRFVQLKTWLATEDVTVGRIYRATHFASEKAVYDLIDIVKLDDGLISPIDMNLLE